MILSRNMLKRVGESRHCSEPVSYAAVEEDGTSGLVIEVLVTWIRFVMMLYFFMVAQKSCMPNPIEGLLEVYEDMVEVSLVLEIFLT